MIDTHCHILSEYYGDISNLIEQIKASGVEAIIINGTDLKSNMEVLDLVKKYDIVYGAIGFHPTELNEYNDECLKWLEEHICMYMQLYNDDHCPLAYLCIKHYLLL